MKKLIGVVFALTLILLFITNSGYVELIEVCIIVGSISIISVIYNLFLKEKRKYVQIIGNSAFLGISLALVFSLIDLAVDHYKLIQGVPDGRFLTLGETISEFSDDLTIIVLIVMCSVALISFITTTLYWKFFRKTT
jgi:prepilin signal peptidase PulO-like enzyme (type II secretory pathway)